MMDDERYDLAIGRIREIKDEQTVAELFQDYFYKLADFACMIDEVKTALSDGSYAQFSLEELQDLNHRLYADILPGHYGKSYANPTYAVSAFGKPYGQALSFLYTELRGAIAYVFEGKTEYLDILLELFLEIYGQFEQKEEVDPKDIEDTIYWYASDYADVFVADHVAEQLCPDRSFATDLIMNSDLSDFRYLYRYGEYISDNELGTAKYLAGLGESVIRKMADVFTEGYRIGFIKTGKDLSKKSTVNIRYVAGFERVVRLAIGNFADLGLQPVIYRSSVTALTKRGQLKVGFYGGIPNKQYEYDHRDDQSLFLDKRFVERKLEVIRSAYEQYKEQAKDLAGPACMETFGEVPFSPENNPDAVSLTKKQEELAVEYENQQGQLTNQYVPGDERGFTIIDWPVPEIGPDYREIFDETIRINTLDNETYEQIQQILIDALDQGTSVHILGKNGNQTDLTVRLHPLKDPDKETIFENCTADENIPVGEVFTSPVLEGTDGVLNVSLVYLNDLQFTDLSLSFKDGMVTDYNCANFDREEDSKAYIRDNVLMDHPTLPMGEFAIGTNTTAYVMARKYHIEDRMPILIAEKTGPHFAVGDTCYSWAEDVKVYNPDGKEIIARDNQISLQRKTDVSKAYFGCHTDITIPYDELGSITVQTASGAEILLIRDGRFVLPGTEILNEPLDAAGM